MGFGEYKRLYPSMFTRTETLKLIEFFFPKFENNSLVELLIDLYSQT